VISDAATPLSGDFEWPTDDMMPDFVVVGPKNEQSTSSDSYATKSDEVTPPPKKANRLELPPKLEAQRKRINKATDTVNKYQNSVKPGEIKKCRDARNFLGSVQEQYKAELAVFRASNPIK